MAKWISVKDRLPDVSERCIFWAKENEKAYVGNFYYTGKCGDEWFATRDGMYKIAYSSSHWMPLPEPPKED